MRKVILKAPRHIHPFNEPARDLRIQNKPLWLIHRDVLAPHTDREFDVEEGHPIPETHEPCLVYRDNLYFDEAYIEVFLTEAKKYGRPCQAAFSENDLAFTEHTYPLSTSYKMHQLIVTSHTIHIYGSQTGPVRAIAKIVPK